MSYIATNTQHEIPYNFAILPVDNTCSSNELSYTWSNLVPGEYQFSVVEFTSRGPGEAANVMLFILPSNGKLMLTTTASYGVLNIVRYLFLQKLMANIFDGYA